MPLVIQTPAHIRAAARNLYADGATIPDIARRLSVPRGTVAKWRTRYDWMSLRIAAAKAKGHNGPVYCVPIRSPDVLHEAGARTKRLLAEALERAAAMLANEPLASLSELAGSRGNEGRASVIERVTSAGRVVFGWGGDGAGALIVDISGLDGKGSIPGKNEADAPKLLTDSTLATEPPAVSPSLRPSLGGEGQTEPGGPGDAS